MQDIAKSSHTRFDTLDGMRGIAAISVLLCHYAANAGITTNAYLANDLFFILSGFVIAHSYGTRVRDGSMGAVEYMAKRFIRLYPMYLVGLLIGLPALYLFSNPIDFIWKSCVVNALYLPYLGNFTFNVFAEPDPVIGFPFPADPPAWSLFFEIVASAAFLVLAKLSRKGLIATIIVNYILFIVIGLYYAWTYHIFGIMAGGWNYDTFLGGFPRVIFGFAMGILLYELLHDKRLEGVRGIIKRRVKSPWILYVLLFLIFAFPKEVYGYYGALVMITIAPAMVYAGALVNLTNKFDIPVSQFLGWMSYPIYCLHFPLGGIIAYAMGGMNRAPTLFTLVATALTVVVCILVTRFYEEPVRLWLSRHLVSRRNRASQVALQR